MQTLTAPEVGQLYVSADESMAIIVDAITGGLIHATTTELRPPEKGGGMDIAKRPVRLSADEWADLARIHGLSLTSR